MRRGRRKSHEYNVRNLYNAPVLLQRRGGGCEQALCEYMYDKTSGSLPGLRRRM